MNELRWLLRAKRWAQNPPSIRRVLLTLTVLAACLALYGIEKTIGLPDWMQLNNAPHGKPPQISP